MKACLVAGGAGIIGSNFVCYMLQKYYDKMYGDNK
jgi:dTDP-D-glucose 4,6-dehydratase